MEEIVGKMKKNATVICQKVRETRNKTEEEHFY